MSPDPEKKSDDRLPSWSKLIGRQTGKPEQDPAVQQFLQAAGEPHKTEAAWRVVRRSLVGRRVGAKAARQALEHLKAHAPAKLDRLARAMESRLTGLDREPTPEEQQEDELRELAFETAAEEAAGETPTAEALDLIESSPGARDLLTMLRDLTRAESDWEEAPREPAPFRIASRSRLVEKPDGWVIYNPPPEEAALAAALEETPRAGVRLGPWVLGEIAEVVAAAPRRIQKVPLSLELPVHQARINLQVRPDYEDIGQQETWVYEVNLATDKPLEIEVGWGTKASRTSGWEPLGDAPVQTMIDPPTDDPVWLYLRCRSGAKWLESRQEIPMLKELKQ